MSGPLYGSTHVGGSGVMRAAVSAFAWEQTPVGPIAGWSNSLRNIVNLVVNSRHPMFLWWGPELVQFYNDAYRASLGADPGIAALGARGREFWAEIWPTIGPQIDAVMQRGEATWNEEHLVPITRNGRVEEVYWTYGYSPVWDDNGDVGGTLVVVQEQTERTLAARRVRTVRDLASTVSAHRSEADAWGAGLDVLSSNAADVPWVIGFASDDSLTEPVVGQRPVDVLPESRLLQALYFPPDGVFRRVLDTGRSEVVHGLRALLGDIVVPPWPEPIESACVIPLHRARSTACYGLLAVGLSPRLPFDEAYTDFLSMAADQFANGIANARAHEDEQRHLGELAQLSTRFRDLLEQAPAGVAVFAGREHRFELANPIYRAITHRSDVIGRRFLDVFPEVRGTALASTLDRVYETGEPYVADEYMVELDPKGDGRLEEFYYSFNLAPLRSAGAITGLIVVAIDVTQQIKARRDLRRAQERLDFTLDAAGVGYWALDLRTREAECSLRHFQIFGYAADSSASWTFERFLSHVDHGHRARVRAAFEDSACTGADVALECPIFTKAGERRWIQVHGRAERLRGAPVRLLGIVHDVTERHDLLAREQAARRHAEQASHAKDQFLASLSHELRTPMNTIIGWTDLLCGGSLSIEDEQSGLATIQRHARLQARLIEDLLDMGRIVSGKVHLSARLVRLASVIDAAVESVANAASVGGVTIAIHGVDETALVQGDAALLQQVFWNLLGNAVKFTPAGGRVTVSVERSASAIEIAVRDTGKGISPEFLPHVFDRFRQEDGTYTRAHGGLGIGLSIVKQLVGAHGGTIRVASAGHGHGACFTIALPEASADAPSIPVTKPAPRLDGARVLVVEDDPETRELIRLILTGANANVITAQSAAEALGAMSHQRFDLLVSDIGMPHEDGYEFIRRVRALPPARGGLLPALALTAYGRPEDRERALIAGFQLHATKPLEPTALLHTCGSLLLTDVSSKEHD